jgi:predicted O-methyltransferase YrrM
MTESEIRRLFAASCDAKGPGALVEVGSWAGSSALVILAGQHETGQEDIKLYCIDNFERGTKEMFDRNLTEPISWGEVIPLVGPSVDFALRWPKVRKIKFLFLDGDHTYRTVKREIELFQPFLLPGAIVAFHDCFYRAEPGRFLNVPFANIGVSQAIREMVLENQCFGWFEREYSLLATRYQPDPSKNDYPAEARARFIGYFDQQTSLHSGRLKLSYCLYHVARRMKRVLRNLGLLRPVRFCLRVLGLRRLYGEQL